MPTSIGMRSKMYTAIAVIEHVPMEVGTSRHYRPWPGKLLLAEVPPEEPDQPEEPAAEEGLAAVGSGRRWHIAEEKRSGEEELKLTSSKVSGFGAVYQNQRRRMGVFASADCPGRPGACKRP